MAGIQKQKGENLATHEDIDKLRDQVAAVTTTTEQIKAEISDAAWNRQWRLNLKRKVLLKAAQRLSAVDDALLAVDSMVRLKLTGDEANKVNRQWHDSGVRFDEARVLMSVVCTNETIEAFQRFLNVANGVAARILTKEDTKIYGQSVDELRASIAAAQAAIRKELGTDIVP